VSKEQIAVLKANGMKNQIIVNKIHPFVAFNGTYTKDIAKMTKIPAKKIVDALNDVWTEKKYGMKLSDGILDSESEKMGIKSSQMLIVIR
jgi:hypothetical protein